MRSSFSISVLIFLFVVMSCTKDNRWDCFKSYGKTISEIRDVPAFIKVKSNDKVNVTIYQGSEQKVEVVAGKNIIESIKTSVEDGVLIIEDRNVCNFVRGYKHYIQVNITVPYLRNVENNSVANMTIDGSFKQDSIFVRAENSGNTYVYGSYKSISASSHGNGDIYLSGTCDMLFAYSFGTNFLQAFNLTVKNYIFVDNWSLGDCNVNASSPNLLLEYHIADAGNIRYKGNPNIQGLIDEGAKGKVIKAD